MATTETEPRPANAARREFRNAAVCAGVILLVYVGAHAALISRFPWFVDETFYAVVAQNVQGDPAQRFLALVDHKGLDISWIAAFLIHLDIPPMDAMRLISIGSGIVTSVASGYLVWRWRPSVRWALVAAGLAAFVPYMFVHDSVGIYDPFVAAGSMVAIALELELARRLRLDLAMFLGFTLGALVLAKPTGNLAIVLLPASLLMLDWRREGLVRRLATWLGLAVLALVIAGCMYLLTRLSPLAYTPEPQNHRTISDFFNDPFANWARVAPDAWDAMWGYLTPPGVILAAWGTVRTIIARDRLGIVVVLWAAAAIGAFLFLTDTAYPRYGLQAVPPLCILIVIGVVGSGGSRAPAGPLALDRGCCGPRRGADASTRCARDPLAPRRSVSGARSGPVRHLRVESAAGPRRRGGDTATRPEGLPSLNTRRSTNRRRPGRLAVGDHAHAQRNALHDGPAVHLRRRHEPPQPRKHGAFRDRRRYSTWVAQAQRSQPRG